WGWNATIDGKDAEIGRVDYVLRALNVPAGKHEVVFTFAPQSIDATETIAYVALGILLLLIVVAVVLNLKKKKV
ncbi:MAG: YfhO family protein, partial [Bacteroidaceae bacterium]|nr:YfhO family protein [Bacteroidaceae bacterium]